MKSGIRRTVCALFAVILIASAAAGCAPYASKYNAIALVTTNTAKKASMSFYRFEGMKVFRLTVDKDSVIKCSGKLESGSAAVCYVVNEAKTELFKVGDDGYTMESTLELKLSGTVYMIVESLGQCTNGEFSFIVE